TFAETGEIKIWDVATGRELLTFKGHQGGVHAVAYSPDGRFFASAGGTFNQSGEVKIWDATSYQQLRVLKGHTREVIAIAFSQDGRRLASASGMRVMAGTVDRSVPGEIKI